MLAMKRLSYVCEILYIAFKCKYAALLGNLFIYLHFCWSLKDNWLTCEIAFTLFMSMYQLIRKQPNIWRNFRLNSICFAVSWKIIGILFSF